MATRYFIIVSARLLHNEFELSLRNIPWGLFMFWKLWKDKGMNLPQVRIWAGMLALVAERKVGFSWWRPVQDGGNLLGLKYIYVLNRLLERPSTRWFTNLLASRFFYDRDCQLMPCFLGFLTSLSLFSPFVDNLNISRCITVCSCAPHHRHSGFFRTHILTRNSPNCTMLDHELVIPGLHIASITFLVLIIWCCQEENGGPRIEI